MKFDIKEASISLTKSAFNLIPFAGTALTELVFEYNGRIKQNRLNRFIELLSDCFELRPDINLENIKTEEFNDLFESVLRRVVSTSSEIKLKRFRDIAVNKLTEPIEEYEFYEVYLDLVDSLTEQEIIILQGLLVFDKDYVNSYSRMELYRKQMMQLHVQKNSLLTNKEKQENEKRRKLLSPPIDSFREKYGKLEKYTTSKNYNLSEGKFTFFKQRLFSKGLLIDFGIDKTNREPFELMCLTELGLGFLNFIENKKSL